MFRCMGTLYKDTKIIASTVISDETADSRTHKIFNSLDALCREFDLEKPIWLDSNIKEFQKHSKTRFHGDNFIEVPEFDYFEICILEE